MDRPQHGVAVWLVSFPCMGKPVEGVWHACSASGAAKHMGRHSLHVAHT
jgi:hypothetical protein